MNAFDIGKNAQERAKRLNQNECLTCGYRLQTYKQYLTCINKDCKERKIIKEMN